MADCVTCSVAVSSLSRSGPVRLSECSTDSVVKLSCPAAGSRMYTLLKSSMTIANSSRSRPAAG